MAEQPSFYDPARIGSLFYPDSERIARDAAEAGLSACAHDKTRTHLLVIDMQVDFCHERGALHVPGAKDDIRRLIEFIYANAEFITTITCSLDSHLPHQIFHASWWEDKEGKPPPPLTVIKKKDVQDGVWRPRVEKEWSREYVDRLEQSAKKDLVIWPYHVPIGGIGHAMDPELWSAVFWHSIARKSQPVWWTKGSVPKTEHYSALQPEIPVPERPEGDKSDELVAILSRYDYILIAGEAKSHCVLETAEDLLEEFSEAPGILRRLFILRDCTSSVTHPTIDFDAIAEKRFAEFAQHGINFIKTTDPMPFRSRGPASPRESAAA